MTITRVLTRGRCPFHRSYLWSDPIDIKIALSFDHVYGSICALGVMIAAVRIASFMCLSIGAYNYTCPKSSLCKMSDSCVLTLQLVEKRELLSN